MSVTSNQALRTLFTSDRYRLGLRWWLGVNLVDRDQGVLTCVGCQSELDSQGNHLLCCPRINYATRHNAVQEALASILQTTGQGFSKEVPIPNCPDGQLRPADLLLRAWDNGLDCAVDITVSHGWQLLERSAAVSRERWRSFLSRKEAAKKTKYAAACRNAGWSFCPCAFGTWGGIGPEGAKMLARILKRAASWETNH